VEAAAEIHVEATTPGCPQGSPSIAVACADAEILSLIAVTAADELVIRGLRVSGCAGK
jgi:hypothetical protein